MKELGEPFTGWTIDRHGILHTASSYKCTPQLLEAARWSMGAGTDANR